MCSFKVPDWAKLSPHWPQTWGFSPVTQPDTKTHASGSLLWGGKLEPASDFASICQWNAIKCQHTAATHCIFLTSYITEWKRKCKRKWQRRSVSHLPDHEMCNDHSPSDLMQHKTMLKEHQDNSISNHIYRQQNRLWEAHTNTCSKLVFMSRNDRWSLFRTAGSKKKKKKKKLKYQNVIFINLKKKKSSMTWQMLPSVSWSSLKQVSTMPTSRFGQIF